MISRHLYSYTRNVFLIVISSFSFCMHALAMGVTAVLQASPAAEALSLLKVPKPVAMRLIAMLRPVYLDSYRTHGQSLDCRTYAT